MNLSSKKRMAAVLMKVGVNRVKIRPGDEENVDEAITKSSIRGLISSGSIFHIPEKGISRGRHRAKSNKRNAGSRKGKKGARLSKKEAWMLKVRSQRKHLKIMKAWKKALSLHFTPRKCPLVFPSLRNILDIPNFFPKIDTSS